MAKRFISTDVFKDPFVRGLDAPHKLLWNYLITNCSHAGIWIVDFEAAKMYLGLDYDKLECRIAFAEKIVSFDDDRQWFIPSFIVFQYGQLNPKNRAHNSVIMELERYNLDIGELKKNKPLITSLQGRKDMDKDKDKDTTSLDSSDKPPVQKVMKLAKAVGNYFNVNEATNHMKFRKIYAFVEFHFKSKRIEWLKQQMNCYHWYKDRLQEKKHGIDKFIGDLGDEYQDGALYSKDWQKAWNELKPQENGKWTAEEIEKYNRSNEKYA